MPRSGNSFLYSNLELVHHRTRTQQIYMENIEHLLLQNPKDTFKINISVRKMMNFLCDNSDILKRVSVYLVCFGLRTGEFHTKQLKSAAIISNLFKLLSDQTCLHSDSTSTSEWLRTHWIENFSQIRCHFGSDVLNLLPKYLAPVNVYVALVLLKAVEHPEVLRQCSSMNNLGVLLSASREHDNSKMGEDCVFLDPTDPKCVAYLLLEAILSDILAKLTKNIYAAHSFVCLNGVHRLGHLLLLRVTSESSELVNTSPITFDTETTQDSLLYLHTSVFLILKQVFRLEYGRRLIKELLPASILAPLAEASHSGEMSIEFVDQLYLLDTEQLTRLKIGMSACDLNNSPGREIRDYNILELLGCGAYGNVYKGRKNVGLGQKFYAIKEVSTTQALFGRTSQERQQCIHRIVNEVHVIKQHLRHSNIVRYYKTFVQGDKLYIVMELISGISLTELINCMKEGREFFKERRLWKLFIQMVMAIRYLHREKAIVHRDLSSNNIMISSTDKVTVTDFGLARQTQWEVAHMSSTVGTLVYACPEIVQNQPYGEGADIWSLGCILYQMCTHSPPFESDCILTVASKIVKGEYEPIGKLCSELYSDLVSTVVQQCLTTDPSVRPNIEGIVSLITIPMMEQLEAAYRDHHTDGLQENTTHSPIQSSSTRHRCLSSKSTDSELTEETDPVITSSPSMENNWRQGTSCVTVEQTRLKAITEPLHEILQVVRSFSQVCLLAEHANTEQTVACNLIKRYWNRIVASDLSIENLKRELMRLARKSTLVIDLTELAGLEDSIVQSNVIRKGKLGNVAEDDEPITYSQLMHMVDLLLATMKDTK